MTLNVLFSLNLKNLTSNINPSLSRLVVVPEEMDFLRNKRRNFRNYADYPINKNINTLYFDNFLRND
jgi:hypothetical protein